MRLFARIKPPGLADLRPDQKAGEIFAGIVRIQLAHERKAVIKLITNEGDTLKWAAAARRECPAST